MCKGVKGSIRLNLDLEFITLENYKTGKVLHQFSFETQDLM